MNTCNICGRIECVCPKIEKLVQHYCTICTRRVAEIDGEKRQDAQGEYWICKDTARCAAQCFEVDWDKIVKAS